LRWKKKPWKRKRKIRLERRKTLWGSPFFSVLQTIGLRDLGKLCFSKIEKTRGKKRQLRGS